MIRACIFDMGNVLVFFSHARMCEQVADLCGTSVDNIREFLMTSGVQNELETGRMSDEEFRTAISQKFDCPIDLKELKQAAADIFTLNDEIVPVLTALKQQGMKLILLSNTSNAHYEFIKREFQILEYFDDFTLSFDIGAMKPAPAIYEDAVRRAGIPASECFFTDDIQENITGAEQIGLHGAVFTDAASLKTALATHGIEIG